MRTAAENCKEPIRRFDGAGQQEKQYPDRTCFCLSRQSQTVLVNYDQSKTELRDIGAAAQVLVAPIASCFQLRSSLFHSLKVLHAVEGGQVDAKL